MDHKTLRWAHRNNTEIFRLLLCSSIIVIQRYIKLHVSQTAVDYNTVLLSVSRYTMENNMIFFPHT